MVASGCDEGRLHETRDGCVEPIRVHPVVAELKSTPKEQAGPILFLPPMSPRT